MAEPASGTPRPAAESASSMAPARPATPSVAVWLVASCLALLGAVAAPVTGYMDLDRSAAPGGDADGEAPLRPVPVAVRGLEREGAIAEEPDTTRMPSLRRRIAANVLLRSGYLTSASLQADADAGDIDYLFALRPEVVTCAVRPPPDDAKGMTEAAPEPADAASARPAFGPEQAYPVAIATVAVEKFNRNPLQRKVEWWLVEASVAMTLPLPDMSLGPAQIRPSTLRWLARQPGAAEDIVRLAADDRSIVRALSDECVSLGLATAMLTARACRDCDDAAGHAIRAYAGQRSPRGSAIDHAEVVQAIAAMIR